MLSPQFVLPIADELIVDLFAGGGGASTGIEQAIVEANYTERQALRSVA